MNYGSHSRHKHSHFARCHAQCRVCCRPRHRHWLFTSSEGQAGPFQPNTRHKPSQIARESARIRRKMRNPSHAVCAAPYESYHTIHTRPSSTNMVNCGVNQAPPGKAAKRAGPIHGPTQLLSPATSPSHRRNSMTNRSRNSAVQAAAIKVLFLRTFGERIIGSPSTTAPMGNFPSGMLELSRVEGRTQPTVDPPSCRIRPV